MIYLQNDVLLFKSKDPKFKGKLYSPKGQRSVTVHLNGIEAVGVWTMVRRFTVYLF